MVDLLLIRPNDSKAIYGDIAANAACEQPFWAGVIASFCRKNGYAVEILDAEVYNMSPEDIVKKVNEINPKLIGITVTGTNLSASTWKMHGAGICADKIKECCDLPIFMWGLHPSALPARTLEDEKVDFVIKGEGLDSICRLIDSLGMVANYDEIPGLYYWNGNIIKGNPSINITKPEDIPEPAWDLMPMKMYKPHNWQRFGNQDGNDGYAVIATSLGCPFQCSFCAVSTLFGMKKVRYINPQEVIKIIDDLVLNYKVKYIKILDECFVLNMKHVETICDLIIERNYELNIWAYARVDTVNKNILEKLRKAGIRWLAYGIESASEISLGDVSKGKYGLSTIREVVNMTQEADIYVLANFMFGLPEDTKESMEMTLDLAKDLNPEFINFYCTMAYPGSNLYWECLKNEEKLPDTWLGYSQYSYECEPLTTKYLSGREILEYRDYAFNEFFRENSNYFKLIREKFGEKTVLEIKNMLTKSIKRRLFEG